MCVCVWNEGMGGGASVRPKYWPRGLKERYGTRVCGEERKGWGEKDRGDPYIFRVGAEPAAVARD